jgi:TusA-related sulfurtransferase
MKCPQPVLKVAIKAPSLPAGATLEVQADCPTFANDIKKWCTDSGKVLVSCVDHGAYKVATIQF